LFDESVQLNFPLVEDAVNLYFIVQIIVSISYFFSAEV